MAIKQFRVLPEHCILLQNAYVRWNDCETGAPCIDPKRPYGNSDVTSDVARILNPELGEADLSDEQEHYYLNLHQETQQALEIILQSGVMMPGLYQRDTSVYRSKWQWVPS